MASRKQAEQREICPASQFAALESGTIHRATRDELRRNGGVCAKCRRQFDKAHKKAIARKPLSVVQLSREQWSPRPHQSAYIQDDSPIEYGNAAEFDFQALSEPEERNHALDYAAATLQKFATRLIEKATSPHKLWVHIHALCYSARMHPRQERPAGALARELGTTKASFSIELNYWRDVFGLPAAGNAKPEARDKAAAARLAANGSNGHAPLDGLLSALTRTEREAHRRAEHIRGANRERRAELRDRLRPMAKLYERLEAELAGN